MIRKLLCWATGYRYYYRIQLTYRTKDRQPLYSATMTIAVMSPKYIDDHRSIKKEFGLTLMKDVPRRYLYNGDIVFEPVFYLGFFKK